MMGLLGALRNWRERRELLGEMRRDNADRSEQARFTVQDNLTEASIALESDNHRRAAEIWEDLMRRFPSETRASPRALSVLLRLRRYDEAEDIMRASQKNAPGDPFYAVGLAEISAARNDWQEALVRAEQAAKRFPGALKAHLLRVDALSHLSRFDEADAVIRPTMRQFPSDMLCYLAFGRIAVDRKDWPEALARWEAMRAKHGDSVFTCIGIAQALINMGRFDDADAELANARIHAPTDPNPVAEFARCAEARGNREEALRRWHRYVNAFPMFMPAYFITAEAFHRLGEPADAEATLRAGTERFPLDDAPLRELAKYLQFQRRDFPGAAEAWANVRQLFPANEEAYERGAEALQRAGRQEEAAALIEEHRARFGR